MKESKFIEQNKDKWLEFESLLEAESRDPDRLSKYFIQVSDDLSYARTFYNNRKIRLYLNNLCQQLFYIIYKSPKKRSAAGFMRFWRLELPLVAYQSRRELLVSFLIFILAASIGVISSINDPDFVRTILGDQYVDMTVENIDSGDPMAVYKKMNEVDMFLGITFNNLLVALCTFLMGILWAIGSIIILMYNGIMIGCFQYFFVEQGLFTESFLTIWMHGTLEISAIVIAGASGIVLGKGIISPGTYSRLQSFQISAKNGARLFAGIVPVLVFAALIESFVTRYTEIPDPIRLMLIAISLIFVLAYFGWYPRVVAKRTPPEQYTTDDLQTSPDLNIIYKGIIKSGGDILQDVFLFYRIYGNRLLRIGGWMGLAYATLAFFTVLPSIEVETFIPAYEDFFGSFVATYLDYENFSYLTWINGSFLGFQMVLILKLLVCDITGKPFRWSARDILPISLAILVSILINLSSAISIHFLLQFFLIPPITFFLFVLISQETSPLRKIWQRTVLLMKGNYGFLYGLSTLVLLVSTVGYLFLNSPFPFFYLEFIRWNVPISTTGLNTALILINTFLSMWIVLMLTPLITLSCGMAYFTFEEKNEAINLKEQILKLSTDPHA